MTWDHIAPRVLFWVCWVLYRLRCPSAWPGAYLVLGTLAIGFRDPLREWMTFFIHTLDMMVLRHSQAHELSVDQVDHRIALTVLLLSCYLWCVANDLFRRLHSLRRGKYEWRPPEY